MISTKILLVNCIVAYSLLLRFVNGDRVEELVQLVLAQESVMYALESYMTVEVDRLSALSGYLERFKHERDKAVADPLKYIGHPLNCFLLIKSLTTDLEFTKKLVAAKRELKLEREWTHPRREELKAAARGVARPRQTRGLLTGSLTYGPSKTMYDKTAHLLTKEETPIGCLNPDGVTEFGRLPVARNRWRSDLDTLMSSNDCLELGRILYEEKQYEAAGDWLLEAYSRADPVQVEVPTSSANTLELLGLVFVKLKLEEAKGSSSTETNNTK